MYQNFVSSPSFTKNMLAELHKVVKDLLVPTNQVSTLEVKNELRKRFPHTMWNQDDISNAMNYLHHSGELKYTDNGTFRVYSSVVPVQSTKAPVTSLGGYGGLGVADPKAGIKAATPAPQQGSPAPSSRSRKSTSAKQIARKTIGKNDALRLIQDTNNKFFGVTFIKKDGSVRRMTCRLDKNHPTPTSLGYMMVIDADEQITKNLNLQTLSEVRCNKTIYTVR